MCEHSAEPTEYARRIPISFAAPSLVLRIPCVERASAGLHPRAFASVARLWRPPSVALMLPPRAAHLPCSVSAPHSHDALPWQVLRQRAGSSALTFKNSPYPRDCDANGVLTERLTPTGDGMCLEDFAKHPMAMRSSLSLAHVLALRLYTTAAFESINRPLRDRQRTAPHPFPATVMYIREALQQLRHSSTVVHAGSGRADEPGSPSASTPVLWRGLCDVHLTDDFLRAGGTEFAPMSTSKSLEVALKYSASIHSVLLKIHVPSFMQHGASLQFLSAFPSEAECLYPPLTFLQPMAGRSFSIAPSNAHGACFTVVEVIPHMS